eukprot:TRINITY_DN32712_c0_g1_i2.p1 TRINITY_DN32712_c0_g1~~TRINITY_DN32712_c0_g1_i2.p1  ORF type:complete len:434 (-),score=73.33 TRINITY_DN32712_c0_g1_i2:70-1320(-)
MSAKQMLNQLKAQELKQLCKEEGLDHTGSKMELIQRIVAHKGISEAVAAPPSKTTASPPREAPSREPRSRGRGRGRGRGAAVDSRPRGRACPSSSARLLCSHCSKASEIVLSKDACDKIGNSFVCLDCRVRAMDPFNPVVKSGSCTGILHTSQMRDSSASFSLELGDLRKWRREALQIEMRMVCLDDAKLRHVWPHELKVSANRKEVFKVVPAEEGHKRRDVPKVITAGLAQGSNAMTIEANDPAIGGFAFALVLTSPKAPAQLAGDVRRSELPEARDRVKALLAKLQGQSEITCLTSDRLKLLCPLMMERVNVPVRGEHCEHLQCFSLEAFLVSNQKMSAFNSRWVCPVCSLVLRPTDLRIDAFVEDVLAKTAEDVEEVALKADGTWKCSAAAAAAAAAAAPCILRWCGRHVSQQ